ncbi:MAG: rod shape-determining protein [SAR324 cluster bacterium]|nr:rod shape-determining protein [SAR324 cluster bacterium]
MNQDSQDKANVTGRKKQLMLGIDLGTSKIAVCSERGSKAMFRSVVGYPRDIIGSHLLKGDKAIGEEVLEKRSFLDAYYPLEEGVIKEESEGVIAALKDLLQHAVSLAKPEKGDEICAVIGAPAGATYSNKEPILKAAREFMKVALVVSEPFMVAYGMNKLNRAIIVDIGAGTTDICALTGTIPSAEDQSTILKGGDYIDKVLNALLLETYPEIQLTPQLARKIKEKYAFVGEIKESKMVKFRENGKPKDYDAANEIKAACETLILPIVEQIENLLLQFDPDDQEEALKNIYLAGNGSRIRGLDTAIIEALSEYGEVKVSLIDDPDYAGCTGALKLATDIPLEHWSQVGDQL